MTMRKIKKAVCVLAAAAMTLCLSSCMSMENGLVFSEDGTVRIYCDTTIEEEALTSMEMTKEDFLSSVNESETSDEYADFQSEPVEKEIDGKAHVGQRYYKDMTYDELNAFTQGVDGDISAVYSVTEEGGNLNVIITYTNNEPPAEGEEDEAGSEMGEYIAQGMMTTFQSVSAPYEIVETNGTVDSETGTVTWDILDVFTGAQPEMTLTVTYKLPASPLAAIIIIAAVVVIAVVAVVLVLVTRKNKQEENSNPAEMYAEQQTESVPVQEASAQTEDSSIPVQTEAPAQEENRPAYCEICGMQLSEDDNFCPGCGEKIN